MLARSLLARASLRAARATAAPSAVTWRAFATAQDNEKFTTGFLHGVSDEQARKALDRSAEIRAQHHAAAETYPEASQGDRSIDADEANRKRVIYRSKQRGWLEVDLLLGSWAAQNVMALSAEELQQYEDILNQETIDIFNYISGKDEVPKEIDTPIMKRLQEYAFSSPLGKASIEGFAENKKYMSN